jgi:hypothetical protein
MPIRHRLAAATGVVAIAAALALVGAAPASAHSGNFFVNAYFADRDAAGFGTISTTDAALTGLPQLPNVFVSAIEIYEEKAWGIYGDGQQNNTILRWDHTTGALMGDAPITLNPAFDDDALLVNTFGLDTTKGSSGVPDGTILTLTIINFGDELNQSTWLSSIDGQTGVINPLVDLAVLAPNDGEYIIDSVATDPTTGITYVFFISQGFAAPLFATVDIATDAVGTPVELPAVKAAAGNGYIPAADFNDAGVLYFLFDEFSTTQVFAKFDGAPSASAAVTVIGPAVPVSQGTLAYDPAPKLANTGLNFVNPAIAALALLGLGGAVVVISRRRLTA